MDSKTALIAGFCIIAALFLIALPAYKYALRPMLCANIDLDRPEYTTCSKDSDCGIAVCSCLNDNAGGLLKSLYDWCDWKVDCLPLKTCGCVNGRCTGETEPLDGDRIEWTYQRYLEAEENCDIDMVNTLITNKSREIVHWTCSNMANEMKCYLGREHEIRHGNDTAVVYLLPFNHKIENPFFLTKENDRWRIDLYKMSNGLVMGGSICDSGWGWGNNELADEFCSYFPEDACPEENYHKTTSTTTTQPETASEDVVVKTDHGVYLLRDEIQLNVTNNRLDSIAIEMLSSSCLLGVKLLGYQDNEWALVPLLPSQPLAGECPQDVRWVYRGVSTSIKYAPTDWIDYRLLNYSKYKIGLTYAVPQEDPSLPEMGPRYLTAYSNEFMINRPSESGVGLEYCEADSDCVARFFNCNCSYHCINRNVEIRDCSKECIMEETPVPDCVCVGNECAEADECSKLKTQVSGLMGKAAYCKSDGDCMVDYLINLSCPFGCHFIRSRLYDDVDLERAEIAAIPPRELILLIEAKINEYAAKCPPCEYECPVEPAQENIVCLNNSCTDITDLLTHPGIDDWDWDSGQDCNGLTMPEQCETLEWPISYGGGCRKAGIYNCYECLAEKNGEPNICERITLDDKAGEGFLKDNCYWRLAVKFSGENKKDKIDFCERFVEQGHKKACYEITAS